MKRRLAITTEIISPYRIPLFNDLARHPGVDLHVIFLADTDPGLRQWHVYKEELQFSYVVLPSWRMRIGKAQSLINRGITPALKAFRPDAILCGGYNYIASWQALAWARRRKIEFLLWSESHLHELRNSGKIVEYLKDKFVERCDGFVVPGQFAREYLCTRRVKDELIFEAPNAVDNALFARGAAEARAQESDRRRELNLPGRYFLFVGRLVREKGVFELLSAYARLEPALRRQIGLVFAGDGQERTRLEQEAASISVGTISFPGFVHREQLPSYYALAQALILPTYTDTWGLVINEGMACGLPIILSKAAGCAPDLIRESWNGFVVEPRDVSSLSVAMQTLAVQPELKTTMGRNSLERIAGFSPQQWSVGIARALGAER